MSHDAHQRFDLKEEVLKRLEICVRKFRDRPPQKYLEEVAAEMAGRLKLIEIERFLSDVHLKFERFPTMLALNACFKKIENERWRAASPQRTAIVQKNPEWISRQAPGTPAKAEALFELIKKNDTDSGAFRMARSMYSHLTDDQIWEAYGEWHHGKVHQLLFKGEN